MKNSLSHSSLVEFFLLQPFSSRRLTNLSAGATPCCMKVYNDELVPRLGQNLLQLRLVGDVLTVRHGGRYEFPFFSSGSPKIQRNEDGINQKMKTGLSQQRGTGEAGGEEESRRQKIFHTVSWKKHLSGIIMESIEVESKTAGRRERECLMNQVRIHE